MGTLWTVWPLDKEMKSWLDEISVGYPEKASRFPTGREIKDVLDTLSNYDVKITDNGIGAVWQAFIASKKGADHDEWTLLTVSHYSCDDKEQALWFEKGWERLIIAILKKIAVKSGPLVLIADADGEPIIISNTT